MEKNENPRAHAKPEKPLSVLLLCESEKAAQLDKRALREAGIANVAVMTSGAAAARLLAGAPKPGEPEPDMVVCLRQLEDMDGEQFCAIVRQHPRLLGLPVLLILASDSEAAQLRALGCGASNLLGRPYSVDDLKKQLAQMVRAVPELRRMRRAGWQKVDTSAFDEALATYGLLLKAGREPGDYLKAGMKSLGESRWSAAIAAFERALRDARIKAEAELGLAAAYKGKGDMPRFKAWLARASDTFVAAGRWSRARAAYARLLQHDAAARNPFLSEAHRLIRAHEYNEAASVLAQSMHLMPKARAGERCARVCMAADDPEAMFQALEASLAAEGDHDFLGVEIRGSLDQLAREREKRDRELAAERKWQLAQAMARKKAAEAAAADAEARRSASPSGAAQGKAPRPGERLRGAPKPAPVKALDDLDSTVEDIGFGSGQPLEGFTVLAPLSQREATTDLFNEKPRLNELLSVIKLTWKLAAKSRKA